jgi:hypothetical protein
MIDQKAKDAFGDVVEDCLVEIHGIPRPAAQKRSLDLRARIESPPSGMSSEIFYHTEPFDVACDIAGKPLDLSQYRPQYEPIASRHNW